MRALHQGLANGDRERHTRSRSATPGFTVTELLIVSAIIGTLGAIAIPLYFNALENARVVRAIADITDISIRANNFRVSGDRFPNSLAEIGADQRRDPWGRAYNYLLIRGVKNPKGVRKDKGLKPINSDFDLYSVGKDGLSEAPLTAKKSEDDIVRANDGTYVGLARDY